MNDMYISIFDENRYLSSLNDSNLLNNIYHNYLYQYQSNTNIELLIFKYALDYYVCKRIIDNNQFIKTKEFNNYLIYLKRIVAKKIYTIQNQNGLMVPLELNVNPIFKLLPKNILSSIFSEFDVYRIIENNKKYIDYLYRKISNNNILTTNELNVYIDYLNNKKEYDNNECEAYIKYLFRNINNLEFNNNLFSSIVSVISNGQVYLSNTNNICFNRFISFTFNNELELNDVMKIKNDLIIDKSIMLMNLLKQGYLYYYLIIKRNQSDVINLSFTLNNNYINSYDNYSELFLEGEVFAWNKVLSLLEKNSFTTINNNAIEYIKLHLALINTKKVLAIVKGLNVPSEYFKLNEIKDNLKNNLLNSYSNSPLNTFLDYQGDIIYHRLFQEMIINDNGYELNHYMLDNLEINDIKSLIGNGTYTEKDFENLIRNIYLDLNYYYNLFEDTYKSNTDTLNYLLQNKCNVMNINIKDYYFGMFFDRIKKIDSLCELLKINNLSLNSQLEQDISNLFKKVINELITDYSSIEIDKISEIYYFLKSKNNLNELSTMIENNINIHLVEKVNVKEEKKSKKRINIIPFIQKYKWIMLGAISVLCLIFGIFIYINNSNNITLANAKMFPSFDKYIEQYVIYTRDNYVEFKCSSYKYTNCNKKVELVNDLENYYINNSDKTYHFKIYKLKENEASVKINKINGIPNEWAFETYVSVELDNPEFVDTEYSFDGGQTFQEEREIKIVNNTNLSIVVKDYFGYQTEPTSVVINKIDNELPKVQIKSERQNDNSIILKADAKDEISGIGKYVWSNKKESNSIQIWKNGTYEVTVYDKAGNSKKEKITIKEKEKDYTISFEENGKVSNISCKTFANYCEIETPSLSGNSKTMLGWSSNKNDINIEYKPNQKIKISSNKKFYAIKRTKYTAHFVIQDNLAVSKKDFDEACSISEKESSCSIQIPLINPNSGYEIIGWSKDKNVKTANISNNQKISIDDDSTYYLITRKKSPLTAKFVLRDSNLTTSSSSESCYLYNGAKNCTINVPTLSSKKSSVKVIGWNNKQYAVNSNISNTLSISSNTSIYSVSSRPVSFEKSDGKINNINFIHIKKINNISIEVEEGVEDKYFQILLNYINQLNSDYFQLFKFKGNIVLMNNSSYVKNIDSGSAGATLYLPSVTNIFLRMSQDFYSNRYFLLAYTHEMFHSYDFLFGNVFGKEINSNSDVKSLFNKYSAMSKSARPLRDYSYLSKEEFLADAFAYYYSKSKSSKYYSTSLLGNALTSDISSLLKKYLDQGYNYYKK